MMESRVSRSVEELLKVGMQIETSGVSDIGVFARSGIGVMQKGLYKTGRCERERSGTGQKGSDAFLIFQIFVFSQDANM